MDAERCLSSLPSTASKNILSWHSMKQFLLFLSTSLLAVLIPCIGILLSYYKPNASRPSRDTCTCSCWDGLFKGPHPRLNFLFFYFNTEYQTLLIFVIAYVFMSLLQVIVQSGIKTLVKNKSLAPIPTVILILSCYSNIYGVWSIINYINESSSLMYYSQWFFVLTEIPITYSMMNLLDKNFKIDKYTIILLFSCALLHLILALPEKMLWSLFFSGYDQLPVARDLLLMGTDFVTVFYSILLWKRHRDDDIGRERRGVAALLLRGLIVILPCWLFYKLFCAFE